MIFLLYNILLIWFYCNFFRATAARPGSGVVNCVLIHFDALQAFLSAFCLAPYNYIISILKRLKRANKRATMPYLPPGCSQAIHENSPPGCTKHATRPKTEPNLDIKIMAFILIFQPQKVLGCVSKIEFFKNPKILDRGDF